MEIWLSVVIFILGLCVGSFINMLIFRIAISYQLMSSKSKIKSKNRSYCDYCHKQLKWYENIPVLSWAVQKGETRCCRNKLPVLYPIVEITTGVLFLIVNYQLPVINERLEIINYFEMVISLIIVTFLVFSAVFDFKYMILPDFSTVILIFCALVLWCLKHFGDWSFFLSAILSFGFLGFLYLITKKKGMGFGDVKLAIFMGLFLGYPKIIVAFYVAFIAGALVGLILIIKKKVNKKTPISFGPFLILGVLVAWFVEKSNWYLI